MLYFDKVSLRRGKKLLFNGASFTIHGGDKVGLTGANGSGKSSIFSLILDELEEDAGSFRKASGISISHMAQEVPVVQTPAIEYVIEGDQELVQIQLELKQAEEAEDGLRTASLHQKLEVIDGYSAVSRAARLIRGLGFSTEDERKPTSEFSGGWRMRLNLAQAMMCRSDLLLLDEPTNHLDLETIVWLEKWLRNYRGALILISHDRDFLDNCSDHIANIEEETITLYKGNYSDFERMRAEKLALRQAAYEKQQRQIEHMSNFITRFRAKATKAKQAQSRVRTLERMKLIAPAHIDSPFRFQFGRSGRISNPLLDLKEAGAGYDDIDVLKNVFLSLAPGDRVGLLGSNGAGKSTLIKLLANEIALRHGERRESKNLRVGYFAQHQLESLDLRLSPLQCLQVIDGEASEKDLRNFLGGFNFIGEMVFEPVAPFSGGEKARLVLAMLVYRKPNLLLLDEPANHLDLGMRHALTMALQDFEGAMVLVSHDRHMLRAVCDSLVLVSDGGAEYFSGSVEDYAKWLIGQRESDLVPEESSKSQPSRKDLRRQAAERRQKQQPLRNRLKTLEASLEKLQARQTELEAQIANPKAYQNSSSEQLKELNLEYGRLKKQMNEIEEEWLLISEKMEKQ